MKLKKIFGIAGVTALSTLALAACNNTTTDESNTSAAGGDTETSSAASETKKTEIKVWCADNIVTLTEKQCADFLTANPAIAEAGYTFKVEACGEGDAASNMVNDVEAGADVYCFPQDQVARLSQAGCLGEISSTIVETISKNNDPGSVGAATFNGKVSAFPLTSDNGFFMYYDKRIITEDIIGDMTKLIKACEDNSKYFAFQLQADGAWYNAGFFFATGCKSTWTANDNGKFVSYVDTYNSANGLIAMKGMSELINSKCYVNASSVTNFNSDAAVVVSGTWDYSAAVTALGENLGVAELPSFTVDGQSYHIGSFGGFKLVGVKPQVNAQKYGVAQRFAEYFTSEKCQNERFEAVQWGPSNINAQQSEAVKANPALAALAAQSAYAIPQGQFPGDWWSTAAAIGTSITGVTTDAELQAILTTYAGKLDALLDK